MFDIELAVDRAKIRKANMSPESLARLRKLDRDRKRKEYKISTAGTELPTYVSEQLVQAYPAGSAAWCERECENGAQEVDALPLSSLPMARPEEKEPLGPAALGIREGG